MTARWLSDIIPGLFEQKPKKNGRLQRVRNMLPTRTLVWFQVGRDYALSIAGGRRRKTILGD